MLHVRKSIYLASAVALSLALTACGTDGGKKNESSKSTADIGKFSGDLDDPSRALQAPALRNNLPQGDVTVNLCRGAGFDDCENPFVMAGNGEPHGLEDNISSIRNPNDFAMTFYADQDFTGDSVTIPPKGVIENLNPAGEEGGLNDRISSWQPQIEAMKGKKAEIKVCADPNFGGECQISGVAQFGTQLNDQISSILNESEFDVYFYTDEKFRGAGIEIPSHTFVPNLNPDGVNDGANDKISSWVPHLGQ